MKAFLLIMLASVGCQAFPNEEKDRLYLQSKLLYYYDKRTELCFAASNPRYNNSTLTMVPCSEAVMAQCSFIGSFPYKRR